ncbi:hypothetical protein BURC_02635 [Burkholderiaceae bacterium]|nr:hypothetical protein BURC_02635 [Burkholderiaceae bacterium]
MKQAATTKFWLSSSFDRLRMIGTPNPFGLSLSKPPRVLSPSFDKLRMIGIPNPFGLSLSKPCWHASGAASSTRGLRQAQSPAQGERQCQMARVGFGAMEH